MSRESFTELLRRAGVNRPVFYSMLTRGTQGVAALVSILLVAQFLERSTQGYYFTILGFIAFVQLAEFGLTYAVMQSASHEVPAAQPARHPEPLVSARLAALLRGATRFNAAAITIATVMMAAIGTWMLDTGDTSPSTGLTPWALPWIAALLAVGASQLLNPRISLLEGAGFVSAVWLLRLAQEVSAAVVLWTTLLVGGGLWAIALSFATRVVVGVAWLVSGWRPGFFATLRPSRTAAGAITDADTYWWREVWPFQWRMGVSALSGYLIFQFFTPLMFVIKGPTAAGQFGMTLALTNGLLVVTTAWLTSQAPLFGQLIATRSYDQLDRAFVRSLRSSFLVVLITGAVISVGVLMLDRLHHPLAQRLLPPGTFLLFVAATAANHVIFAMATYLRAHRREPLMFWSIIGAVVTPIAVAYVGQHAGVAAIAATYLVMTVLGLGITALIFVSRSRAWHVDSYA